MTLEELRRAARLLERLEAIQTLVDVFAKSDREITCSLFVSDVRDLLLSDDDFENIDISVDRNQAFQLIEKIANEAREELANLGVESGAII